ncbi:hypothetical protein PF010_g33237 [Phytophthora fragariae]|uniref:RxLR effector protein n=1 Tax=Phytophthora fragariae TaxID=53985 RepID=A0A6A3GBG2_9STRA|nr:hypothetical protein PF011_g33001 [Phytophthora fragariae]KAE9045884.1 hypothetical protein PF010_g33237 [Phytophthora fragariae]KAE9056141.1 hypothetical protein PF006_g32767 [Phytophthora fragariae]KAE9164871.1 hypothetical protein PF002_g31496 [Phytophthora fragariae]KAE9176298.1 hypothetical protein PF004_g26137 [Phytophthora fragariae]
MVWYLLSYISVLTVLAYSTSNTFAPANCANARASAVRLMRPPPYTRTAYCNSS